MSGAVVQISKKSIPQIGVAKTTKEAWAAYVRRRFPTNTQANCEREWDLSTGRANGLVWSNTTQTTIDHILHHRRGGPFLSLEVEAIRFGLGIEAFLERCAQQEREAISNERRQLEARERRAETLEAMARERRRFAGEERGAAAVRARATDGRSGASAPRVGRAKALDQ